MQAVIISGGSSGIGLACVNKFLHHGYLVYNFDIIQNDALKHINYRFVQVDMGDVTQIRGALTNLAKSGHSIHSLVIAAGKHLSANIENTSDDELIDIMYVNLLGAFWLIQSIIPHMKQQQHGTIITIGSDQSTIVKKNSSAYAMTKAAIASLTKSIAVDYAKYNIRANCIASGTIDTPLYRKAINNYCKKTGASLSLIEAEEANAQPLGRIGSPHEIADLAYFLSQDTSSYITASVIAIDGGYTAI